MEVFFEQPSVPVHSCLLVEDRKTALEFPRADIVLALCNACGFITNTAFDAGKHQYSTQYEETQAFSPHFTAWAQSLANRWVESFGLQSLSVLEIGCGKGEFLEHVAQAGVSRCIGIDPGIMPERLGSPEASHISWIQDFFDERYLNLDAEAVICRHTLEHVSEVGHFVDLVVRLAANRDAAPVLFELPDTLRVLREGAFWDVYYEHCSYFTPGSLGRLFRSKGVDVQNIELAYDDQYILLEGVAGRGALPGRELPVEEEAEEVRSLARSFTRQHESMIGGWRDRVSQVQASGGRVAIWGGGSKGVAFLHALRMDDAVDAAVDINPRKHDKFIAGSGHQVVSPAFLTAHPPSLVIAMNPVYQQEIRADLDRLGVGAQLLAL